MSIEDTLARLTAASESQAGAVTALAAAVTALTAVVTGRSMARAEGPDESSAPAVPTVPAAASIASEDDSARIAAAPIAPTAAQGAPAAAPAAIAPTEQAPAPANEDDGRVRPETPVNPAFTEKNASDAEKDPNCEVEKRAEGREAAGAVKAEQAPMTLKEFADQCKLALGNVPAEKRGAVGRVLLTHFGVERLFQIPSEHLPTALGMLRAEVAKLGAN